MTGNNRFVHLSMLRGICALLVVMSHLRNFVMGQYRDFPTVTLFDQAIAWLSVHGHNAVMVFFVLSGFFVSRSAILDQRAARFTSSSYGIKRLSRLWLVLIPCLAATLLWDFVGAHLGSPAWYHGQLASLYSSAPTTASDDSLPTLLANALFLQTIMAPTFGSNAPLWSLAYEFWYYVLFAIGFIVWLNPAAHWLNFVRLTVAVLICAFVGENIVAYGSIWLLGVGAFLVVDSGLGHRVWRHPLSVAFALIALLGISFVERRMPEVPLAYDICLGLSAALLVLTLAYQKPVGAIYGRVADALAGMSYTIYLAHFPFMCAMVAIFIGTRKFTNADGGYLVMAALGGATMLYCVGVYMLTERHDVAFRRQMTRILSIPALFRRSGSRV